jgi:hypothetical protein
MESSSAQAKSAYRLYLFLRFCLALPAWVVVAVYLVREAKLDPLQLVLMGTVMEAAVFVFEIPTGVVADLVSRRLSLHSRRGSRTRSASSASAASSSAARRRRLPAASSACS